MIGLLALVGCFTSTKGGSLDIESPVVPSPTALISKIYFRPIDLRDVAKRLLGGSSNPVLVPETIPYEEPDEIMAKSEDIVHGRIYPTIQLSSGAGYDVSLSYSNSCGGTEICTILEFGSSVGGKLDGTPNATLGDGTSAYWYKYRRGSLEWRSGRNLYFVNGNFDRVALIGVANSMLKSRDISTLPKLRATNFLQDMMIAERLCTSMSGAANSASTHLMASDSCLKAALCHRDRSDDDTGQISVARDQLFESSYLVLSAKNERAAGHFATTQQLLDRAYFIADEVRRRYQTARVGDATDLSRAASRLFYDIQSLGGTNRLEEVLANRA